MMEQALKLLREKEKELNALISKGRDLRSGAKNITLDYELKVTKLKYFIFGYARALEEIRKGTEKKEHTWQI